MIHACCLLVAATMAASPGDIWPGFLGAGCSPTSDRSLPLTWSSTNNIAWRVVNPGRGISSPVVWKDSVFMTTVADAPESTLRVTAFQLSDGKVRWTQSLKPVKPIQIGDDIANAVSTPAVDSEFVFALFGSGDLVTYSHAGEMQWRRSLAQDFGKIQIQHGLASSLAQDEGNIFVLVDHEGESYLAAFNKRTGETSWRTIRSNGSSWSSPIFTSIAGVPQLVISSAGTVDSYDANSGQLLWTAQNLGGNIGPSAAPCGEGSFLIGAYPHGTGAALVKALRSNLALHVTKVERNWRIDIAWQTDGAVSSYASPIAHRDLAYWVDRQGVLTCMDVATGEQRYTQQLDSACWATPLAIGGRIYFFGNDGKATVIATGPEFRVLAKNQIQREIKDNQTTASSALHATNVVKSAEQNNHAQYAVAAVDGSLLIRTGHELICVRDLSSPEKAP